MAKTCSGSVEREQIDAVELLGEKDIDRWKLVKIMNDVAHMHEIRAGAFYYKNEKPDTTGLLSRTANVITFDADDPSVSV